VIAPRTTHTERKRERKRERKDGGGCLLVAQPVDDVLEDFAITVNENTVVISLILIMRARW